MRSISLRVEYSTGKYNIFAMNLIFAFVMWGVNSFVLKDNLNNHGLYTGHYFTEAMY